MNDPRNNIEFFLSRALQQTVPDMAKLILQRVNEEHDRMNLPLVIESEPENISDDLIAWARKAIARFRRKGSLQKVYFAHSDRNREHLEKALELINAVRVNAFSNKPGDWERIDGLTTEAFLHIKAAMGEPEHLELWERVQNETL